RRCREDGRLRSTGVEIFDHGRTPVKIFDRWLRPQSNIFDYGRIVVRPQSNIFDWSRNFPATGRKTIGTTERGGRTPVEIFDRWLRPQSNCSTTVEWWFDPSRIVRLRSNGGSTPSSGGAAAGVRIETGGGG
ncbi:hypothetical protein TorRG33x02_345780, partial [Trema orientale]